MALLEALVFFLCFLAAVICILWYIMAPPDVRKERSVTEKLDVTKNRFTASKVPSNLDVIIIGSGI